MSQEIAFLEVEVAKQLSSKREPNEMEIAEARERIIDIAAFQNCSREQAAEHLLRSQMKQTTEGATIKHILWAKMFFLKYWEETNELFFCIDQFFTFVQRNFHYEAKSTRGLGDSLGAGHGKGLYLDHEVRSGRKHFRIPSPQEFASWYDSGSVILPFAYYTEDALAKFIKGDALRKRAGFLSRYRAEIRSLRFRNAKGQAELPTQANI